MAAAGYESDIVSPNLKPAGLPPLLRYALRRLLAAVALAAILSVAVFVAMSQLPGDIPTTILGTSATPQQVEAINEEYHLNDPLPARYAHWLSGFFTGDLGTSIADGQPVADKLLALGSNTLQFSLIAILLLIPVAVGLGILSAVRAGRTADHLVRTSRCSASRYPTSSSPR